VKHIVNATLVKRYHFDHVARDAIDYMQISVSHSTCTATQLIRYLIMAALWDRAGRYILALWFLSFFFLFFLA